jgi:hypothetical protein
MRVQIPPIDVPVIDLDTGRMTTAWYDAIKALEGLRLIDLADVPQATPTATGQRPTWNNTTKRWDWV